MLDLKKLEKELDDALAKETPESLEKWLTEKRWKERREWFQSRIGKIVWRNKDSCVCSVCKSVYESGLLISDEQHASYVHDCEGASNADGIPLKYFDTKEERDEYELLIHGKISPMEK